MENGSISFQLPEKAVKQHAGQRLAVESRSLSNLARIGDALQHGADVVIPGLPITESPKGSTAAVCLYVMQSAPLVSCLPFQARSGGLFTKNTILEIFHCLAMWVFKVMIILDGETSCLYLCSSLICVFTAVISQTFWGY